MFLETFFFLRDIPLIIPFAFAHIYFEVNDVFARRHEEILARDSNGGDQPAELDRRGAASLRPLRPRDRHRHPRRDRPPRDPAHTHQEHEARGRRRLGTGM